MKGKNGTRQTARAFDEQCAEEDEVHVKRKKMLIFFRPSFELKGIKV